MNYWAKRQIDIFNSLYNRDAVLADAQLQKEYQATAKRIIREMRLLYNEIKDGSITSVSSLYEYNRYYELMNMLNDEMLKLNAKEITIIEPRLANLYKETSKAVGQTFSLGNVVNTALAKDAVDFIWAPDGKHWSDRIWKSGDQLKEALVQVIVDCAVSGRKESEMANELVKKFGVSYQQASRLVRTEMSYIQNRSALDKYSEAGLNYYEVLPATDAKVCDACKALEGRQFRLEDADIGTNFPPIHPNDRCAVIGVLPNQEKIKAKYRAQGQTPKGLTNSSEE